MEVFCDESNLEVPISLGNHLLNFSFCANLCNKHGYGLRLPCPSDIESVADHSIPYGTPPGYIVEEFYIWQNLPDPNRFSLHNLSHAANNSKIQYERSCKLLQTGVINSAMIRGYFRHPDLFDLKAVTRYLKWKDTKYQLADKDVVVHIRGTDYIGYACPPFKNCILERNYYKQAIEVCKRELGDFNLLVMTDDPELAECLLDGYPHSYIEENAADSWLILKDVKNVIASVSTFCWTACLYNKKLLIQPIGGLNFEHPEQGEIPYGFSIPGSIGINGQTNT